MHQAYKGSHGEENACRVADAGQCEDNEAAEKRESQPQHKHNNHSAVIFQIATTVHVSLEIHRLSCVRAEAHCMLRMALLATWHVADPRMRGSGMGLFGAMG